MSLPTYDGPPEEYKERMLVRGDWTLPKLRARRFADTGRTYSGFRKDWVICGTCTCWGRVWQREVPRTFRVFVWIQIWRSTHPVGG